MNWQICSVDNDYLPPSLTQQCQLLKKSDPDSDLAHMRFGYCVSDADKLTE